MRIGVYNHLIISFYTPYSPCIAIYLIGILEEALYKTVVPSIVNSLGRVRFHHEVDYRAVLSSKHQHSGIKYVTPNQRHTGEDKLVLEERHRLYLMVQQANSERWSGKTRNWSWNDMEILNPSSNVMRNQQIRQAA